MLIDYQNVNIYQNEKCILSNVNFNASEGEFIYIIGKVGSGKSTLLKTFYCELDIDKDDQEKGYYPTEKRAGLAQANGHHLPGFSATSRPLRIQEPALRASCYGLERP